MEAERSKEDDKDKDKDKEFEELLNMPDLENEELNNEVTAKIANLSEVKKISSLNALCSKKH
jgi:hypothetical protein